MTVQPLGKRFVVPYFVRDVQTEWCRENLAGNWSFDEQTGDFSFDDVADEVMFKLRFDGAGMIWGDFE